MSAEPAEERVEPPILRPVGAEVRSSEPPSLEEELRANRNAMRGKRTKVFDLPGFPRLAVRYKAIDLKVIERIQRSARRANEDVAFIHAAADIIGACCEEVLVRDDEDKTTPLVDQREAWGDEPIRFDERLAELVGVDAGKPRIVIENVFGVFDSDTGNDVVMMDHADEIIGWIKSGTRGADSDF